ncbi:carboxylic acid reductase [Amycolatopsis sp. CA-161197]|uniref:carboxylic acid reductase n=1 Tax=Amycolatopsis sp. CA-161197 TaxID=3239922 RepID=UPI003D9378C1
MTTIHPQDARGQYERRTAQLCENDSQVRDAIPRADVREAAFRPGLSLAASVAAVMAGYADRPALGERARETFTDPATGRTEVRLLPRFETISYGDLWARATAVASEWHHDPHTPLRRGDFVATLGFVSSDYVAVELACVRLGAVSVPLQAGAAAGTLKPILEETGAKVLVASPEYLGPAVDLVLASPSVLRLVVFDYIAEVDAHRDSVDAARARLSEAGSDVVLDVLPAVVERGCALPAAPLATADLADPDPLAMLIYTSGSTGTPKGAMYTERVSRELWRDFMPGRDNPAIVLDFLPMSHVVGQNVMASTLGCGGTVYLVGKSDLSTMLEDYSLVRPTELLVVPRICEMLFQHYRGELDGRIAAGGFREGLDEEVKTELREKTLGGRILWAGFGSAPLSAELTTFMESLLHVPMHDGYGATETGGVVMLDGKMWPHRVSGYRLLDVPELGYFSTDLPHPRGELVVQGGTLVTGYYRRPDTAAEVFDAEGYYHTGDIMAEHSSGELVYVDRRKNVLKLSQGEFVAVSKLEAVFAAAPLVEQIYVYGSSERSHLLAVIVPTRAALADGDPAALKRRLSDSLQQAAKEAELNSYEIPRDFLVETEPFSTVNGLLTGIKKLQRPALKKHYGERLEALYAEIADREGSELRELRQLGLDRPVVETVARAAEALLGASAAELGPDARFSDLGGDSLSALSFSNLLRDIFGVDVPVDVVISPANDLRAIARHIEDARKPGVKRPTFATVHGAGSTVVHAADLTLGKFVDAETLALAKNLPRATGTVRTVLLTGANGYLGRFLCLEWLERLAETGGKLVCLVRGRTAEAAYARLEEAFDTGDIALLQHFRELAAGHLEVLAGDIGSADLGLAEPVWQLLADTVDLIVHPAALVNHVLPYDQLFGPNVVGTAELIRLAITARLKPITYLSTFAVAAQAASGDEVSDIRETSPSRTLDDSYANGYGTSKWAGEVLLREANDAVDLPVTTFRSDLILAHSRYAGQLNVPDMFTRLVLSLIVTGIAPRSFYSGPGPAHFDGLPVDFTAEAITALGLETEGYRTYNVLNSHEDGVSLDTYVDWLVAAGHRISRVEDYHTWFRRFETAIRALPEKQKQYSLLPLLHAYAEPEEPVAGALIPADRFRAAVRRARVGTDADIPHVTAELIEKYASDLANLGLI